MKNTDVVKGAEAAAQLAAEMDPRTHEVIGAAMEVHRQLGCGFLEAVYQEALAAELSLRGIEFDREVELAVTYKGARLRCGYKADFVCSRDIIVELKAMGSIGSTEKAQLINYLKGHRTPIRPAAELRRFAPSSQATSIRPGTGAQLRWGFRLSGGARMTAS